MIEDARQFNGVDFIILDYQHFVNMFPFTSGYENLVQYTPDDIITLTNAGFNCMLCYYFGGDALLHILIDPDTVNKKYSDNTIVVKFCSGQMPF